MIPWESRHRTMRPPPSLPGLVTEASPGASGLELWTRQWAPGNWAKGTGNQYNISRHCSQINFEERNAVVKHNFKKACFLNVSFRVHKVAQKVFGKP